MAEFKIRRLGSDEIKPNYGPRNAGVWVDKDTDEFWINADGTHRKAAAPSSQTVEATGTNQATAAGINLNAGTLVNVTEADGTKAVRLPAASVGTLAYIYNNSSSALDVFPATSGTINGGSANAKVTVAAKVLAVFTGLSTTGWAAVYTAAGTYATLAGEETLTNKTLTEPVLELPLIDDGHQGLTITSANQTHATATATVPNFTEAADSFVMLALAQTLLAKTLTNPVINQAAVARTATDTGATTGTIAANGYLQFVQVTTDSADKIIILPTPTPGVIVVLNNGATGYELRSSAPATVAINGGADADAESAIAAESTVIAVCITSTAWKAIFLDADGDVAKVQAAAA